MGILRLNNCMLVVWCPKYMLVIPVNSDPQFYNLVQEKCHIIKICISKKKETTIVYFFPRGAANLAPLAEGWGLKEKYFARVNMYV